MNAAITLGVEVAVETAFQEEQSARGGMYVFAYRISILNHNEFPVRLLRREWKINHGNGRITMVEGEGVIGQQPELLSNQRFQYVSGTQMETALGKMSGFYLFENRLTHVLFKVEIPAFILEAPHFLN
jgi:ApaG protein